jgi:hypothetical protein
MTGYSRVFAIAALLVLDCGKQLIGPGVCPGLSEITNQLSKNPQ